MTFNDDARFDTSKVSKRSGGKGMAIGGGGSIAVILLVVVAQQFGLDLSGLVGGGTSNIAVDGSTNGDLSRCSTGAAANQDDECRVVGAANSLDAYWAAEYPRIASGEYRTPHVNLFEGSVSTACGSASSAVGPFYCPGDEDIYLDTSFYKTLRSQLGADGGSLAQMYVVAHEWGHHISTLTGAMAAAERGGSGPTSDSVRIELQADCYAGAWVGAAATTKDDAGTTFLKPPTKAEIADALDTASAIGDDAIQGQSGSVRPESWTHGSSEQRQRWFTTGLEQGAGACDTFAVSGNKL
ncbi:neutral zinc metallopeptidase [Flavimobilis sp. GY10621]|uniref:Neutral zinc metallopeptidase n=1 Tax=Flavimobilis rhizosphaerae TaxID=2775421 RepID=A0ABR9DRQ4_9MICO|nr:neutral zinc metallopeptidase [Flavimobilis rhizosphaerae]MBD9699800.1 neutral zinc metallopeptidase [Flavimobilis rhizosphaerae]